jgi:hypothetical protein
VKRRELPREVIAQAASLIRKPDESAFRFVERQGLAIIQALGLDDEISRLKQIIVDYSHQHNEASDEDPTVGCQCDLCKAAIRALAESVFKERELAQQEPLQLLRDKGDPRSGGPGFPECSEGLLRDKDPGPETHWLYRVVVRQGRGDEPLGIEPLASCEARVADILDQAEGTEIEDAWIDKRPITQGPWRRHPTQQSTTGKKDCER